MTMTARHLYPPGYVCIGEEEAEDREGPPALPLSEREKKKREVMQCITKVTFVLYYIVPVLVDFVVRNEKERPY
jgi:hypothetical protein